MTQVELFDNDEQGKIWQWFDNDKEVKFDNDNEAFAHATFPSTASRPHWLNPESDMTMICCYPIDNDWCIFAFWILNVSAGKIWLCILQNHGQAPPAIIA